MIEGQRLVAEALSSGHVPDFAFVCPEAASATPVMELAQELRARGVSVYEIGADLLALAARTVHPQGILAVVEIPNLEPPAAPDLVLVADGIRDPGNLGTMLRTALATGTQVVMLSPGTVDPTNDKVVRAAMGAHFRLPIVVARDNLSIWAALRNLDVFVADARAQMAYDAIDWRQPAALVIGSEPSGPSAQAYEHGQPIAIPMANGVESLNAAVAAAVVLFEAARQRRHVGR